MKYSIDLYPVLAVTFLFFGCNNGPADSVKNAKEENAEKIDSQKAAAPPADSLGALPPKADADFLVNTASSGMWQVQLAELAKENSSNKRVKKFGALVIKDRGESGEKLKKLAAAKNITLPADISNDQQSEKEKLQKKMGNEFDRAYIDMMVDDHNKNIKNFSDQAKNATDPDIKAFASNNLPMLYTLLDSAKNLQQLVKPKSTVKPTIPPVLK
jgi:putative membrane protein